MVQHCAAIALTRASQHANRWLSSGPPAGLSPIGRLGGEAGKKAFYLASGCDTRIDIDVSLPKHRPFVQANSAVGTGPKAITNQLRVGCKQKSRCCRDLLSVETIETVGKGLFIVTPGVLTLKMQQRQLLVITIRAQTHLDDRLGKPDAASLRNPGPRLL